MTHAFPFVVFNCRETNTSPVALARTASEALAICIRNSAWDWTTFQDWTDSVNA